MNLCRAPLRPARSGHLIRYLRHDCELSHYFLEFDLYDKVTSIFLTLEKRMQLLEGSGIETVPIVHQGLLKKSDLEPMADSSAFDASFENSWTGGFDDRMG